MTDILTAAAVFLITALCGCVALAQVLRCVTSPEAVQVIEELAVAWK